MENQGEEKAKRKLTPEEHKALTEQIHRLMIPLGMIAILMELLTIKSQLLGFGKTDLPVLFVGLIAAFGLAAIVSRVMKVKTIMRILLTVIFTLASIAAYLQFGGRIF
jgi:glucan phosphoethanolaminetransferase (alkaline phosphatase superfamily)